MKKMIMTMNIIILAALLTLWGCEQAPPPPDLNKTSDQLAKVAKEAAKPAAPEKAVKADPAKPTAPAPVRIWPYLSEQKDNAMAENLLTKNYLVILDGSGSMDNSGCSDGKRKIDVAFDAIGEWIKSIPDDANIGLVSFHAGGWIILKEMIPKSRAKEFMAAVGEVRSGGNTPLATAFKVAYGILTVQAQKQLGYGEYTIVAVTDGEDNDDYESLKDWTNHILRTSPIAIYTIGFCIKGGHTLNRPNRMIYKEANNPAELRRGLKGVLAEAERFDVSEFKR